MKELAVNNNSSVLPLYEWLIYQFEHTPPPVPRSFSQKASLEQIKDLNKIKDSLKSTGMPRSKRAILEIKLLDRVIAFLQGLVFAEGAYYYYRALKTRYPSIVENNAILSGTKIDEDFCYPFLGFYPCISRQ